MSRADLLIISDTTYSEVLSVFKRLVPIPTALDAKDKYRLNVPQVRPVLILIIRDPDCISSKERSATSVWKSSSPRIVSQISILNFFKAYCSARNPTGQCIEGDDLRELVEISKNKTTIILDEFYSWYAWAGPAYA